MARRLKVFEARIGFFDTVVAAPSRVAALRAWGVQQDLFREGQARESQDTAAIEAAKAAPEVVLRRPAGGHGGFERQPALPEAPPARRRPSGRTEPARGRATPEPPPPKPDRRPLDKAEKALAEVEARRERELAALEARRAALEAQIQKTRDLYADRRRTAEAAVAAARKAYRRAGGDP